MSAHSLREFIHRIHWNPLHSARHIRISKRYDFSAAIYMDERQTRANRNLNSHFGIYSQIPCHPQTTSFFARSLRTQTRLARLILATTQRRLRARFLCSPKYIFGDRELCGTPTRAAKLCVCCAQTLRKPHNLICLQLYLVSLRPAPRHCAWSNDLSDLWALKWLMCLWVFGAGADNVINFREHSCRYSLGLLR